ncbi:MAG: hypothetical protein HYX87_02235 [Chloroflexi bacterium]|nr:hypothetical protein [Chloroflexota bacterium]
MEKILLVVGGIAAVIGVGSLITGDVGAGVVFIAIWLGAHYGAYTIYKGTVLKRLQGTVSGVELGSEAKPTDPAVSSEHLIALSALERIALLKNQTSKFDGTISELTSSGNLEAVGIRGCFNVLGLYVQMQHGVVPSSISQLLIAQRGWILQAGGQRTSYVDAWKLEGATEWHVTKYEPGAWENLIGPTLKLAEFLSEYFGKPGDLQWKITEIEAIGRFYKGTGQLRLPTVGQFSQPPSARPSSEAPSDKSGDVDVFNFPKYVAHALMTAAKLLGKTSVSADSMAEYVGNVFCYCLKAGLMYPGAITELLYAGGHFTADPDWASKRETIREWLAKRQGRAVEEGSVVDFINLCQNDLHSALQASDLHTRYPRQQRLYETMMSNRPTLQSELLWYQGIVCGEYALLLAEADRHAAGLVLGQALGRSRADDARLTSEVSKQVIVYADKIREIFRIEIKIK